MYNTAWFSQPQRRRVHLFPTLHLAFLRFERFFGSGCRGVASSCEFAFPRSRGPSEVLWIETAGHSRPPLPHLGGSVLFLAPLGIPASRRPIAAFR
jgi:hypothetical protein